MDIRCLLRGESTRCRKGQQPIPFLYSCSGGNSPGYDAIEQPLRCAGRGCSVLEPGVTQHHLGCWRLRIYLKPLEAIKVYFVNAVTVGLAQCPEQDEALGSRELIHPMQCSFGVLWRRWSHFVCGVRSRSTFLRWQKCGGRCSWLFIPVISCLGRNLQCSRDPPPWSAPSCGVRSTHNDFVWAVGTQRCAESRLSWARCSVNTHERVCPQCQGALRQSCPPLSVEVVQLICHSCDAWNRRYYSTWPQKNHGYFIDAAFSKGETDYLVVNRLCHNKCLHDFFF